MKEKMPDLENINAAGNPSTLKTVDKKGAAPSAKSIDIRDAASAIKIVDTREYVSMLRELTEQGREVSMRVAGNSMSPFVVHRRDSITFRRPDRALKRGDFVFYQRENGQFVCHRIYRIRPEGCYMVGDAQTEIEGPIRQEQIFALITGVTRKGKTLAPGDFWWEFFEKVWIRILPLRPVLIRLCTRLHKAV